MKRKSLLLLLLLALGLPWAAKAQETLTVYENGGTNTNQYIPLYGYYCDVSGTQSQFIIPAAALENMTDGTISKLTFYCSNSSLSFGSGVYEVWLEEVEETEFTSTSYHTYGESAVLVYRGALSASNNMMEITFQTAYEYGGGNLMIGTKVATGGSCPYSYWYGEINPHIPLYAGTADTNSSQKPPSPTNLLHKATVKNPKPWWLPT